MIELKNVTKIYGKGTPDEKLALDNVSLTVNDGDFITVIGSNGAGKSTLFGAVGGSFTVDSGNIIIDGEDVTFTPEYKRAKNIGWIFQDPMKGTAPGMTVCENLYLAAKRGGWLSGTKKTDREYLASRLSELNMGLEDKLDKKVGALSGGQRQALTLMMATVNPPKLLLLDECTAALDPSAAEKVTETVKKVVTENKITCMMITHDMQMALDMGNRTLMMVGGKIVLDVKDGERASLTVPDLLERFRAAYGKALSNDNMLLI